MIDCFSLTLHVNLKTCKEKSHHVVVFDVECFWRRPLELAPYR